MLNSTYYPKPPIYSKLMPSKYQFYRTRNEKVNMESPIYVSHSQKVIISQNGPSSLRFCIPGYNESLSTSKQLTSCQLMSLILNGVWGWLVAKVPHEFTIFLIKQEQFDFMLKVHISFMQKKENFFHTEYICHGQTVK